MKRKVTLAIIIFLIVGITFILVKNKDTEIEKDEEVKYNSSFISMMIEDDKGKYIESKELEFPNEGYMFNPDKSGCENGGLLSWNVEKQKVQASLISSDKCYAYFDKYDFTESCLFGYEDNIACDLIKKKDNTLIYHDGICDYEGEENCDLEAEDLSYRFVGANPDNYICFGGDCSNDPANPNYKNLYRIIGLFKNEDNENEDYGKYEIKLIKADAATKEDLGDLTTDGSAYAYNTATLAEYYKGKLERYGFYYWNNTDKVHLTTETNTNTNMWKDSNLNKVNLNQIYYNAIDEKYQSIMVKYKWQVGPSWMYGDAKTLYNYELGNKKLTSTSKNCYVQGDQPVINQTPVACSGENDLVYTDRVGLIYISDYMYGALPKYWSTIIDDYNKDEVKNSDWLYLGIYEWTISRHSDLSYSARYVHIIGNTKSSDISSGLYGVRPVLYLSSNVKIQSGNGSKENPYRLKLS